MQTVDSGHAAAIAASARVPVAQVFADWAGTGVLTQSFGYLHLDAVSIEVDRSYATALPDGVGILEGHAAAELRVEVTGAPADAVNRFNTSSPLYALPRLNAPITASLGMSGYTPVPQFTGRVRTISSDSRSGTARLEALDLAEKFRFAATLPEFDAFVRTSASQSSSDEEFKVWLNASFLIAEVLSQGGVHVSPPPLAACKLYASLLGSLACRRGYGELDDAPRGPYGSTPPFIQGRTGLALNNASTLVDAGGIGGIVFLFNGLNYGDGGRVQVEFWALTPYTGGTGGYIVEVSNGYSGPTAHVRLTINATGQMSVVVKRHGQAASTTVLGPTPTGAAQWRYYAVHVAYSTTTATVTIRTGTAETSAAVTVGTAVAAPAEGTLNMDWARLGNNVWPAIGSLQVSNNTTPDFSHETHIPAGTLEASMLWLDRAPAAADIPGTAWEILTDIAAAESATVELSETGVLLYRTADRWAAVTTPVATITATADLLDLAAVEDVDTVRNDVVVPISPVERLRSGDEIQMNLGGPVTSTQVLAGATQVIPFNVNAGSHTNTLFTTRLSQGWVVSHADWQQEGHPYYSTTANGVGLANTGQWNLERAGLDADGLGQVVNVTVTNTTTGGLYIGTGSRMYVVLSPPPSYSATDAASATSYGPRAYTLPDSPWRQQGAGAQAIAARLLADLRNPVALLTDVPVVGDPRRQLGDRITVQDPAGLQVDQDYWVIGIRSSFQPGSLTQSLTLRPCNTFRVLKALTAAWNVNGTATQAHTSSWNVQSRVMKAHAVTWNVQSRVTSVSKSLAVTWDVQSTSTGIGTTRAGTLTRNGSGSTTAVTVAYPASVVAGELLTLVLINFDTNIDVFTVPAGWTAPATADVSQLNGTTYIHLQVMYKVAAGTETGSLTVATTASTYVAGQMFATPGVHGTSPMDATPTKTAAVSTSTSIVVPSITAVTAGTVPFYAAAAETADENGSTGPAGSTELGDWGTATTPPAINTGVYRDTTPLAATGATGTRTVAPTTSVNSISRVGVMLLLRPA